MNTDLSVALSDSISEEATSLTADLLEVGLDAVMDEGILKEIPILSTAISLYKIGNSIHDRHYIKKLSAFIMSLNNGIVDEEKKEYYKHVLSEDLKRRDKELEYILILIDRYIHIEKAEKLALVYLSYLEKNIEWIELINYSETLDRFLLPDFLALKLFNGNGVLLPPDQRLRLSAIGLIEKIDESHNFYIDDDGYLHDKHQEKEYILTDFGEKLKNILYN